MSNVELPNLRAAISGAIDPNSALKEDVSPQEMTLIFGAAATDLNATAPHAVSVGSRPFHPQAFELDSSKIASVESANALEHKIEEVIGLPLRGRLARFFSGATGTEWAVMNLRDELAPILQKVKERRLELQLQQSQSGESAGKLTGSAHKNPPTAFASGLAPKK